MTTIDTDPDTALDPLEFSVTRNLAAKSTTDRDAVLANAPVAEHGFFGVPKVIE